MTDKARDMGNVRAVAGFLVVVAVGVAVSYFVPDANERGLAGVLGLLGLGLGWLGRER